MLILKLAVVPLFICAVTLAGRRWGAGVAGLPGGLPVVVGPIVVFVALEQGQQFGALAATAAISAIAGLIAFGVVYSWASIRRPWPSARCCRIAVWFACALGLAALPSAPEVALAVAAVSLVVAPRILPPSIPSLSRASLSDLSYRMLTGAALTFFVTAAAASFGEGWSGIFAVFPIIGLVLAVFTHQNQGAEQMVNMYRGMVKGLYSFIAYFLALALFWPRLGFWTACGIAIGAGVVMQAIVQWLTAPDKSLQPTR